MSDTEGNDEPVILIVIAMMLWIALSEQQNTREELGQLTKGIDPIKDIEPVQIQDLLEDALRINNVALSEHKVTVVKEFANVPVLALDKHRVLLILIN